MGGIAQIYNLKNYMPRPSRNAPAENRRYKKQTSGDLKRMLENIRHRRSIKPISNENDSMRILFSGWIHNAANIRKMLRPKHRFLSDRDGETVLHLYEEVGEECVKNLEGAFAFAVYNTDQHLFIARDHLGIAPLYISESGEDVYIASEFKALSEIVSDFQEFPIGSYYQAGCNIKPEERFVRYHSFSEAVEADSGKKNGSSTSDWEIETFGTAKYGIQTLLKKAVDKRIDRHRPFGVYLSGGLDSSIIAALTAQKWPGIDSFAVGIEGSEDLLHARVCADYLGTRHHEYVYSLKEMLEVLPTVIYHLESFDAALVRSSVPNYFLARMASEPHKIVFSGEGADELFCGYRYMKSLSKEQRELESYRLLNNLHCSGLQRGDRMAAAFGMEARVPFLDLEFVKFALRIPDSMKYSPSGQEKWVLRKAFSHLLPPEIISRAKKKFSIGAGSFDLISRVAEENITDEEFMRNMVTTSGHRLKSKEEFYYYKIFHEFYPQRAAEETVGFSIS